MNNELLTIKEFAEAAGVSKQAIYLQLESRLNPYLVQVENKKMLKKEALEKFYSSKFQASFNQVDQGSKEAAAAAATQQTDQNTAAKMLEMLQAEIEKKDQQIERLQNSLDKAYAEIADLAKKAQYITAADKTVQIMDKQQQKEEATTEEVNAAEMENKEEIENTEKIENAEKLLQPQEQEKKKRWFQFWKK